MTNHNTMPSKEPDYTRYSLEQLERARRSIDVERFPERTRILDILIADRKLRAAEAAATQAPPPATTEESWFDSRRRALEYKTRGQVLLAAAGTLIIAGGGVAIMLQQDLTDRSLQIFFFIWCAGLLVNLGHLLLEYRRLAPPAAATVITQATAPVSAPPPARRTEVTASDQPRGPAASPIERL
ncbi:MAG: hypothetical protein ACOY3E_13165 [Pseudomonadota bacterium]